MKTTDSKQSGNVPAVATAQAVNVVTCDEEQPVHAHPVPVVVEPILDSSNGRNGYSDNVGNYEDGVGRTNPNNSTHVVSGHGCEIALCGNTRTQQMTPGYHFSLSLCGNQNIDLLDSEYPPGTTISLFAIRLCGSMNIIVPPGTQIVVRRLILCGDRDIYVDENPTQVQPAPRLTLNILSLMGSIRVRSSRR